VSKNASLVWESDDWTLIEGAEDDYSRGTVFIDGPAVDSLRKACGLTEPTGTDNSRRFKNGDRVQAQWTMVDSTDETVYEGTVRSVLRRPRCRRHARQRTASCRISLA
jgi:hypothetical protein